MHSIVPRLLNDRSANNSNIAISRRNDTRHAPAAATDHDVHNIVRQAHGERSEIPRCKVKRKFLGTSHILFNRHLASAKSALDLCHLDPKKLDMGRTEIKVDIVGFNVRYRPDYWIL